MCGVFVRDRTLSGIVHEHGVDLAFEKISENGPTLQASGLSVTDAKKRLRLPRMGK